MTLPGFAPEPLRVTCDGCGAEAWTFDYQHPGRAVDCGCCPVPHDHDANAASCPREHEGGCGLGVPGCMVCRPVAIEAKAHLRLLDPAELLDAAAGPPASIPQSLEVTEA